MPTPHTIQGIDYRLLQLVMDLRRAKTYRAQITVWAKIDLWLDARNARLQLEHNEGFN